MPVRKGVPGPIGRFVEEMYNGATTRVRTECGRSAGFPVTGDLHQGSALSPLLFVVVAQVSIKKNRGNYCMQMTHVY